MAFKAVAAADWLAFRVTLAWRGLAAGPDKAWLVADSSTPSAASALTTPADTPAARANSAGVRGVLAADSTRWRAGVDLAGALPSAISRRCGLGLCTRKPRKVMARAWPGESTA